MATNAGFRIFVLWKSTVEAVGLFDENIWPAYEEDCDYMLRIDLAGIPRKEFPLRHVHGDGEGDGEERRASGTLTSTSKAHSRTGVHVLQIPQRNYLNHLNNAKYYHSKWGLTWRLELPASTPGRPYRSYITQDVLPNQDNCGWGVLAQNLEHFKHPFNDSKLDVRNWTFSPELRSLGASVWNYNLDPQTDRFSVEIPGFQVYGREGKIFDGDTSTRYYGLRYPES